MNFDYLKTNTELADLYNFCNQTEVFVSQFPDASVRSARNGLEWVVKFFYITKYGYYPETSDLFGLIEDYKFKSYAEEPLLSSVHAVRKLGNSASHAEHITKAMAFLALQSLYNAVGEILKFLGIIDSYLPFNKDAVTDAVPKAADAEKTKKKIIVRVKKSPYTDGLKGKIATDSKMQSSIDFSEAETRKAIIDLDLLEAGWKLCDVKEAIKPEYACIETKLTNIPQSADFPNGVGYADYVLYDTDGKALAVIEAKRTCKDVDSGAKQAKIYAEALKDIYGVMPVIFYTNGYQIYMVDGVGGPARRVFGYYSLQELHSLIVRRKLGAIEDTRVNKEISDRYFIQNACTKVCETYSSFKRKALNVMATGTGKTRFAISLVDILMRNNWVKNVLFLADRTELVNQAKKAFVKYLPNATLCAISEVTGSSRDYGANIILSTYPTMLNLIDTDDKKFGIGRFDLIIIDECHRSCYNKYQAIFNYFDSLVLGLTATPKEQEGQEDTYSLFGLEVGHPTFDYPFETAVQEGFLVDYAAIDKTTDRLKNGAKYTELTEAEKKEYDEVFFDEAELTALQKVKLGNEFYKNIINIPTVDLVIQTLMNEGLRTDSGEKLGKSIIFATDHDHAAVIVKRFKALYPEKGDDYCQLVDYSVSKASSIIEDFKVPAKEPVVAVSVDMLDTGIDVPEVLNLVFFKRVFSVIKFYQMIGRGTRVCKDFNVFSPSKEFFGKGKEDITNAECQPYPEKQGFYIFDFCDNFDFFDIHPKGKINGGGLNLSQKIFELKLDMVYKLQKREHQESEEHVKYYQKWKDELVTMIQNLNRNLINVRYNLKEVDKYSDVKTWDYVTPLMLAEIKKVITPLISPDEEASSAKVFDVWMFNMELSHLVGDEDFSKPLQKVTTIIGQLLDMQTIPEIRAKPEILKTFIASEFWSDITVSKLESVRIQVRDLIKYLDAPKRSAVETNFKDEVVEKEGKHISPQFKNYKQRVIDFLAETTDCEAVNKIKNIEPLTDKDIRDLQHILCEELGTQTDYDAISEGAPLGVFVRRIVGMNPEAVTKLLSEYLAKYNFNSEQEDFLHHIVTFVLQNGDIEVKNLIKDDPFKSWDFTELFNGNVVPVTEFVSYLHRAIAA
ncbi:MAG: DEAD/DEAH box helicase family protein [Treponemataceae bacterium]|nr:DEAD/DEAH box helicase family protein [Treponemataceae bacterium]